jgi:hypothetical protein
MIETIEKVLGRPGRMIAGSKSGYSDSNPNHLTIFNANICIEHGKVWHGDLDLTLSKDILTDLANEVGQDLYILYEMDARFENENAPLLENAVIVFGQAGEIKVNPESCYSNIDIDTLTLKNQ